MLFRSADIMGKSIKVIIDGGSCHNLASEEMCDKLNLHRTKHPHPYHVQWLSNGGSVKIHQKVKVSFKIGSYEDTVECDVAPMTVCHLLLGRLMTGLMRVFFSLNYANKYS